MIKASINQKNIIILNVTEHNNSFKIHEVKTNRNTRRNRQIYNYTPFSKTE